ncbi:MAG: hypothetical protein V7629_07345 [Motiliproteus sp.]
MDITGKTADYSVKVASFAGNLHMMPAPGRVATVMISKAVLFKYDHQPLLTYIRQVAERIAPVLMPSKLGRQNPSRRPALPNCYHADIPSLAQRVAGLLQLAVSSDCF